MVRGEVAFGQVHGAIGLIVQAVIGLRTVAEVRAVSVIDGPVEATVVAPLVKGTRNGFRRLGSEPGSLRSDKLRIGRALFRQLLALALALHRPEAEELVFLDWSTNRSTEELPAVIGMTRG